ncbi:MAG: CotH kinase family protein [Firmicutes bacterium]|nr:CotH kinase family protein [Bacillota bacterium]
MKAYLKTALAVVLILSFVFTSIACGRDRNPNGRQNELTDLRGKYGVLQEEFADLQARLDAAKAEHDGELSDKQDQIDAMQDELDRLMNRLSALEPGSEPPGPDPKSITLIVNQAYGMGTEPDNGQACSHSFVELYNYGEQSVSLAGLSVQVCGQGAVWQKLNLSGTVPAKHSFLIVLTQVSNSGGNVGLNITDYDMAWDAVLPNLGFKAVLLAGTSLLAAANPFNHDGYGAAVSGYIDMIGVAGNTKGRNIDGYEADYLGGLSKSGPASGVSKQKAVRRINFADTDNNAIDCETIDYRLTENLRFRPRSLADGAWEADGIGSAGKGPVYLGATFPALYLDTNGVPILNKTTYVPTVVSMRNTSEQFMFEDVSAGLRGRGNTTWTTTGKQPFRLRFDQKMEVLDAGYKERSWTLIANHFDKAQLRNYGGLHLSTLLDGLSFTSNAWFVDVYLNDVYRGVYLLCDQIQEGKDRVNLTYDEDPDKCEYLLERDGHATGESTVNVGYFTLGGTYTASNGTTPISLHFPGFVGENGMTAGHLENLRAFLLAAQGAMQGGDYAKILEYIDEASFVDWYILQELHKGGSAISNSVFFQVKGQGKNRRIYMGPVWDFDHSCGNYTEPVRAGVTGLYPGADNQWYVWLLKTEFLNVVKARWSEVKEREIAQNIEHTAWVAEYFCEAFEQNFVAWDIMGKSVGTEPANIRALMTYKAHTDFLVKYLEDRVAWLDGVFG